MDESESEGVEEDGEMSDGEGSGDDSEFSEGDDEENVDEDEDDEEEGAPRMQAGAPRFFGEWAYDASFMDLTPCNAVPELLGIAQELVAPVEECDVDFFSIWVNREQLADLCGEVIVLANLDMRSVERQVHFKQSSCILKTPLTFTITCRSSVLAEAAEESGSVRVCLSCSPAVVSFLDDPAFSRRTTLLQSLSTSHFMYHSSSTNNAMTNKPNRLLTSQVLRACEKAGINRFRYSLFGSKTPITR